MKVPNPPEPGYFVGTYMRAKFRGKSDIDLIRHWDAAYNWICKHVGPVHLDDRMHPLIVAAMFLYMQHTLESDPKKKQAHLYSAYELIAVFP